MSNGQAKAGGERGMNGEFYKGGQFLPSSENTVKGAQTVTFHKGTKKEIAPFVWEASPADDMLSIYDRVNHACADNRRECQYVKGQGFIGFKFTEIFTTHASSDMKDFDYKTQTFKQVPQDQDWIDFFSGLMERFNNGERWYPLSEDPFHYKNQAH
jgi:hypothetical protein